MLVLALMIFLIFLFFTLIFVRYIENITIKMCEELKTLIKEKETETYDLTYRLEEISFLINELENTIALQNHSLVFLKEEIAHLNKNQVSD